MTATNVTPSDRPDDESVKPSPAPSPETAPEPISAPAGVNVPEDSRPSPESLSLVDEEHADRGAIRARFAMVDEECGTTLELLDADDRVAIRVVLSNVVSATQSDAPFSPAVELRGGDARFLAVFGEVGEDRDGELSGVTEIDLPGLSCEVSLAGHWREGVSAGFSLTLAWSNAGCTVRLVDDVRLVRLELSDPRLRRLVRMRSAG